MAAPVAPANALPHGGKGSSAALLAIVIGCEVEDDGMMLFSQHGIKRKDLAKVNRLDERIPSRDPHGDVKLPHEVKPRLRSAVITRCGACRGGSYKVHYFRPADGFIRLPTQTTTISDSKSR